jgi:hypothetical protein
MRYEDVSGPLGDDPRDPELWRREAYPVVDKPTKRDTDADEADLWDWPPTYSGGGL